MNKPFLFFFLSSFITIGLHAQSKYSETLTEMEAKIKEVEPVNIYMKTRFGQEAKFSNVVIQGDSLFFSGFEKQAKYHVRNLDFVKFYKPHPYWKWVGSASGLLLAVGILWFVDTYYGDSDYRFGATEYGLGGGTGSVLGYMIGRGIDSEEIIFEF